MTAHAVLPVSSYTLQQAILVYSRESGGAYGAWEGAGADSAPTSFAAIHDVVADASGLPELGTGRPATDESITALARDLLGQKSPGLVPARTLAISDGGLAWYVPAGHREMHFQTSHEGLQSVSGKTFPHPGLVFLAQARAGRRALSVWAFRRRGRPRPDTALYQAPFLNVSGDGRVCLGSTSAPHSVMPSDAAAWTTAFFASSFTHVHAQPLAPRGPSYPEVLVGLADNDGPFPAARLVPARRRLQNVIRT